MEFLLVWILSGSALDSGLRYDDAASCYAQARNAGIELKGVGLGSPNFTCIPVAEGKEVKLLTPASPRSTFPF